MRTDKQNKRTKTKTYGLTAVLAMLAILVGASVSASLEEFAAPTLDLGDPYYSIVDEATGAQTDEEPIGDEEEMGFHGRVRDAIRDRMPERMEEHAERNAEAMEEHLQKRIDVGNVMLMVFEFCDLSEDCSADRALLDEMQERLAARIVHLQEVLDHPDQDVQRQDAQHQIQQDIGAEAMLQAKLDRVNTVLEAVEFCLADPACDADDEMLDILQERLRNRVQHLVNCIEHGVCERPERDARDHRSLRQHFRHGMRDNQDPR